LDVDVIGANCMDPRLVQSAMVLLAEHSKRPCSAFPSAGLPGHEMSPNEFAAFIKPIVESGARLVGGCCGAGPDHIAAAAQAIGKGR
jgi:5-methyltetrahydrofolate--homocysteine methyltransferase